MNLPQRIVAIRLAVLVLAALFAMGCDRLESWLHPEQCALSGRPIRAGMGAEVRIDGRENSVQACCLRCAITFAQQTGQKIRVLSVTDYVSHNQVRPDRAFYLSQSSVAPCSGPRVAVPASRREASSQVWDRCMPSVIAFADSDVALQFQKDAGGFLKSFAELVEDTDLVTAE